MMALFTLQVTLPVPHGRVVESDHGTANTSCHTSGHTFYSLYVAWSDHGTAHTSGHTYLFLLIEWLSQIMVLPTLQVTLPIPPGGMVRSWHCPHLRSHFLFLLVAWSDHGTAHTSCHTSYSSW